MTSPTAYASPPSGAALVRLKSMAAANAFDRAAVVKQAKESKW